MLDMAPVDEVLVYLVGEHPPAALDSETADLGDRVPVVDRTGGVGGRDEDKQLRPVRGSILELIDAALETARRAGRDLDNDTTGEANRLGVGRPVRGRHQHLVTGVEQGREGVVHRMLATVGDEHLLGRDLVAGVAHRLGHDRLFQLGQASRRGVAMVARLAARGGGGLDDGRRRREVRLASPEANDVDALGLQLFGLRIYGQSGRRRHAAYAPRYAARRRRSVKWW